MGLGSENIKTTFDGEPVDVVNILIVAYIIWKVAGLFALQLGVLEDRMLLVLWISAG